MHLDDLEKELVKKQRQLEKAVLQVLTLKKKISLIKKQINEQVQLWKRMNH
jgi:hypothetical protein